MFRRHSDRALGGGDPSREAILEALLDDLCVTFGFCLPPEAKKSLRTSPPDSVPAFTDAVITGEGLDPALLDTSLRQRMRELVELKAGSVL